jgi:hypothetical protein
VGLTTRRWVWASSKTSFTSAGGTRRSSQGEISCIATLSSPANTSWPTICWVQVVPDLA